MSLSGRFVPPLLMLLAACAIVAPRGAAPPNETPPLLHEARAAYERGDDAVSIVRVEAFIASAPGHPLLAEAQLLLARVRERSGAWATAWEQYRLFLSNYPTHAGAADALARAAALARRHVFAGERPPVARWRVIAPDRSTFPIGDGARVGAVLAPGVNPKWDEVARAIDLAAVDGVRIALRLSLAEPGRPFDPFDDAAVGRAEAAYRAAAAWPIEGFLIDRDLYVAAAAPPPAAQGVMASLFGLGSFPAALSEPRAWAWAGMRARASARALGRFVRAVDAVQPGRTWIVAVSEAAVMRPAEAVLDRGEDLAELREAAPGLVPAIVAAAPFDLTAAAARLAEAGVRARPLAWVAGQDLVAAP